MSIRKKGDHYYGYSQDDLAKELERYSADSYPIDHTASSICKCGNDTFNVLLNEDPGVVARICLKCDFEHGIGDSDIYLVFVDRLYEMECVCGSKDFKVTSGVALHQDSDDVRWFYVGLLCTECGCMGCYGDWKNEFLDYKKLLSNV